MKQEIILATLLKLGEFSRRLRAQERLSQNEVAKRADLTRHSIGRFESDNPSLGVSVESVMKIFSSMGYKIKMQIEPDPESPYFKKAKQKSFVPFGDEAVN